MITVDATSSGVSTGFSAGTTLTFSHTCTGASKLVVSVQLWQDVAGTGTVSGITYNGVALTKIGEKRQASTSMQVEMWYLDAPAAGAHNIVVTISGNTDARKAGSISLIGATNGYDQTNSSGGSSTSASTSVTPSVNDSIIIDTLISFGGTTAVEGSTSFFESTTGSINAAAQYYIQTTAASKAMTWSWTTSGDYSHFVASFKPGALQSIDQEGYRWRNDDGSESAATWAASQDTALSVGRNVIKRLRVLLNSSADTPAKSYRLEYRRKNYNRRWRKVLGSADTAAHTLVGTPVRQTLSASPSEFDYEVAEGATLLVLTIVSVGSAAAALRQGSSGAGTFLKPMYGGKQMTQGDSTRGGATGYETSCELWYLIDPPIGLHTFSIPNSRPNTLHVVASAYKAADGYTSAIDDQDGNNATSGANPSVTSTPTVGGDVIVAVMGNGLATAPTGRSGTTLFETDNGSYSDNHQYTLRASSGAFAMSWTIATDDNCQIACAFKCVAITEEIQLAASSNITASGENTTAQLTAPSGKTTSDFEAGRMQDDENPADSINLGSDKYTEVEWSIKGTSNA